VGDLAYCVCASGFHPRGLVCVPNDPLNPCRDVDCSGHGACRAEGGVPVCDCFSGYQVDPVSRLACLPVEPADTGGDARDDGGGAACGDGRVDPGEGCDDGTRVETDDCRNDCTVARCGDGVVWAGHEACDDGNTIETDDCRNDCTVARCGDGVVWAEHEECDDGNTDDNDACLTSCRAASCGDGFVWSGYEDCDGDLPLGCWTSCSSYGTQQCVGCSWSSCEPPVEICNGADDDCNGATDEAGCSTGAYCFGAACWPLPRRINPAEPYCFDLGVPHLMPDPLTFTIVGRPGATATTWNRHTSCPGAVAQVGSTDALDASGTFVYNFETGAVTDCSFGTLGSWDSWAVVDGYESNHATTIYYISTCPGIDTCAGASSFCP
jgi:cysteine-rich repeat protein